MVQISWPGNIQCESLYKGQTLLLSDGSTSHSTSDRCGSRPVTAGFASFTSAGTGWCTSVIPSRHRQHCFWFCHLLVSSCEIHVTLQKWTTGRENWPKEVNVQQRNEVTVLEVKFPSKTRVAQSWLGPPMKVSWGSDTSTNLRLQASQSCFPTLKGRIQHWKLMQT